MNHRSVFAAVPLGVAIALCGAAPPSATASSNAVARELPSDDVAAHGARALTAITAIAADDVWAVGNFQSASAGNSILRHWDGTTWSKHRVVVQGENPVLNDVSAAATDDVWAVGSLETAGIRTFGSLVLHWNGARWSEVPSPLRGQLRTSLTQVIAISVHDAYASGINDPLTGEPELVTLHWDGKTWSVAASPPESLAQVGDAVSASDAWASGRSTSDSRHTVMQHWDGDSWHEVETPPTAHGERVNAISAVAPDDAWAAGSTNTVRGVADDDWLIHWDGSSWTRSEITDRAVAPVRAVSASSRDEAWLIGDSARFQGRRFLERWNGTEWSYVPGPSRKPLMLTINDIVSIGPSDAWAVGSFAPPRRSLDTWTMHWDGERWSRWGE